MKLVGEDLTCERGERVVFRGVSFAVDAGELLILKGPNGAGKTSLLRLVTGLIEPASGQLELKEGHSDLSIGQQSHFVAHQNAVKPSLTVRENLEFWSSFLGGGDVGKALDAFNMSALADYATALLSAGQLRRLSLSRLMLV
ncbi:MAG: heme ABC exporter ATP-binding protein CcmA, partial [Aestuariivirgaceae bacterium]